MENDNGSKHDCRHPAQTCSCCPDCKTKEDGLYQQSYVARDGDRRLSCITWNSEYSLDQSGNQWRRHRIEVAGYSFASGPTPESDSSQPGQLEQEADSQVERMCRYSNCSFRPSWLPPEL